MLGHPLSGVSRILALVLLGSLFMGVGAGTEWTEVYGDSNNTAFLDGGGITEVQEDYSVDLGGNFKLETNPVIKDGTVFVGSRESDFFSAIDQNGDIVWNKSFDTPSGAIHAEGELFLPTEDGFYALDPSNGDVIDKVREGEDTYSGSLFSPAYEDGVVYYGKDKLWKYDIDARTTSVLFDDRSFRIRSKIAIWNDTLYFNSGQDQDPSLFAVDTDGTERWVDHPGSAGQRKVTVHEGRVFAPHDDGLNVYNATNGDFLWSESIEFERGLAAKDENVFFTKFNELFKYDLEGNQQSSVTFPDTGVHLNEPSIANETIYVIGEDGFSGYNTSNLERIWNIDNPEGEGDDNAILIENDAFYFAPNSGFGETDLDFYKYSQVKPDTEPPIIWETELSDSDGTGWVSDGDDVTVWANVTDNQEIDSAEADMTEFGGGNQEPLDVIQNLDWEEEGDNKIFETTFTVDGENSDDGPANVTVTAEDTSGNINTSDPFGDLEIDTVPPVYESINLTLVGTSEPVIKANITEEDSGLSSDTNVRINDTEGDVFSGTVSGLAGVDITENENITIDIDTRADSLASGNVTVDIEPIDIAGNTGERKFKDFTVDTEPPEDLTIDRPEEQQYRQPSDIFTVNYSYTEPHPQFTNITLLNQQGDGEASREIEEDEEDPEGSIDFQLDDSEYSITAGNTYDIFVEAEDELGNVNTTTGEELLTVDDTPPVLNESEKTGETTFDFHVSDDEALNVSSIEASDFEFFTSGITGSFTVNVCESLSEQCTVSVELDERSDTDEITVGLTDEGEVEDAAGNVQDDDDVTVEGMDEVPPNISDTTLEDYTDDDGIVRPGHEILVHANVTDGEEVDTVEANLTEFGLGDVNLESEVSAGTDFYGDGEENDHVYGVIAEVQESAIEGEGRETWVTATDSSDNSNTTDAFGDLEVDKTPPEIDIDEPLNTSPAFIQPDESLEINYTYTEENPEFLNISIGVENYFFQDLDPGENIEDSRELTDSELPGEGKYDLELWMNDSVSYEGTDMEEGSIFIDGTPPGKVDNLTHNDEEANEGFSVTKDVNFTWDEASDDISGIDFYSIYESTDGGASFQHAGETEGLEHIVNAEEEDEVQIKVQAVDRAGNEGDNETSEVITVDTTPPEVNIYTPISGDNIVNQSEASDLRINGTVQNDDTGEVTVNVSGGGENVSNTTEFSDGTFEAFLDITDIPDGGITVEVLATDEAGNTGDIDSETATKDTTPPSIDEGFKINDTAFNVTFSDDITGLDPETFEASDFETDPGTINSIDKSHMEEGVNEDNLTVLIDPVDAFTVNFSITGEVRDVAGNRLTEGWVEVDDMDSIPPEIKDVNLTDYESSTGVVTEGDEILVHANVTDGHEVDAVEANLTEFGLSSDLSLQSEASAGTDFNNDGEENNDIYGAIKEVDGSAEDGEGKQAWITATDASGNSNTTDGFGDLEVDTTPPEIDIDNPLEASPVFLQPEEDLLIDFTYTEDNPEFVNASLLNESVTQSVLFEGFDSGEEKSESIIYSSEDFPQDGIYDLNLTMNDSAGLEGSDQEFETVYIDGEPPSKPDNLTHNDEEANEGFSVTKDVNFTWDEASDDISGIDFYKVYASTDGGTTFTQVDQGDIFEEIVDADDGDEVQIKVGAVDRAGNEGDNATSEVITVDTTPPQTVIDEPLAENDIVNSAQEDSFEVTGTVAEDDNGEITVNVTDGTTTVEEEFEFSEGDFSQVFDISGLEDGDITVEAQATDEAGNTGDGDKRQIEKDTVPPSMDEAFKIDKQTFNVSFSDDDSGLDPASFQASDFEKDPGEIESLSVDTISEGDQEGNITVEIGAVDSDTVNFSIVGEVQDVAGNNLTEGWVEVEDMDSVPPSVKDKVLTDYESENGIVTEGDEILVHANVTDGDEVDTVTADLTEFGLSNEVTLQTEASAGTDFNGDENQNEDIYGVIETVTDSAVEGEGRQTSIEAEDASGNVNETEEFGDLEVDLSEPIVTVDENLEENPVYMQPDESLQVNYTYSEENPEFLNISIGPESYLFDGFDGGESVSKSETFTSDQLPGEGVHNLSLWMNDSVGLEGTDLEEDGIFIDGTPPDRVDNLEHLEGEANEGYSNTLDVEFDWDEASDDISGVDFYNVYISGDGGDTFHDSATTEETGFTVDGNESDEVQIKLQAVDRAGNEGDNETSEVIIVDTVPPEIEIDTPVEEDDFIGLDEESSVSITGTVDRDSEGQIELNVSDGTDIEEQTFSFADNTFDTTIDVSSLSDGELVIEASATDEAGNTGEKDNHTVVKDTVPPSLDEAFKIDLESFDAEFSDEGSGLDPDTISASDFSLEAVEGDVQSGALLGIDTTGIDSGDMEGNATVIIERVDAEKINFSVSGSFSDQAGNEQDSGYVTLEAMDGVEPEASDKNLLDPVEEDGVVSPGDTVQVYANVTDGTGIEKVTANLTEFGLGDVEMESGEEVGADWNDDGEQNSEVYGTNATIDSSAEAGTASATITAIDNSSNSNELTTEEFGELEIVKEASDINITDPTTADPVYVTPSDDVEVFFEYTEDDPEELNISIGDENQIFTDLEPGENVETSRIYSSDNLPGNGTYDLSVNLSNSGGLQGNDTQASAVFVDEFPPADLSIDAPNVKQYEQSSDSFTVEYSYEEDNPHYTEIRLVNETGDLGLLKNISETETEINGEAEFTELGELDEAVNYTVEVEAFDRAGKSSFVDEENMLVVDDTPPMIENARKIEEGIYEFDALDDAGLYEPSISDDNFRIQEGVEASFTADECSSEDLNCTVTVELLDDTSEDTLTAEIDGSILDRAFNSRSDDNVTLEDTNTVQPGIESIGLNVSTPVNDSYAPGTINISIDFNESMNTDENPSVDINNLETSYSVTGDFDNSTRWTGLFEIQNDDEESTAFVNVSGAEDTAGNMLSEDADSGTFEVDTDEPEVIVSDEFEDLNLSGSVDIARHFSAVGGLIDSFEFDDGTGMEFVGSPNSWDSTAASEGDVDFRVNASDDTGNTDSLTVTSTVDNEPPVIEKASISITDAEEDFLQEGDSFEVEVNASDDITSVEAVNLNVSEVTELEGWRGLEEKASGNYTGEFKVNKSVQIQEYRPPIFVNDSAGNEVEGETDDSVEVDSVPLEVTSDAVYTFLEEDEFDNGIATPGDVINVTWNSSEDGVEDIQSVGIDFGEFGGEVEASQNGELYSATTEIEEGSTAGFRYSGFVDVVTDSEDDNATDEGFVEINNRIPSTPQNLEAEAVEGGDIDLSWDPVEESDLEEYIVFRNGDEEFRIDVTEVPDFPPEMGEEYEYSVAAVDNASNVGPASVSDSAIADDTPPVVINATTYNETTINVTVEDDYHQVVADEVSVEGGEAIGFDENAERLSGIFIMDEAFERGSEPEISPFLKDTIGNERDSDYTVTAENGIRPIAEDITMEDVNLDGNGTLQITYSHSMNTSDTPDVEFSEGLTVQDSEQSWVGDEVFEAVYEFDLEEGLSFTADVTAGNATDDSGNLQIGENSTEFEVNTVRPDPVIHDLDENEIVRNEVLLNGSTEATDIQSVEWSYEEGGENQSIASLGDMVNETVWDTPEEELETVLWLHVENDVGNTGFDDVELEVDNIPPEITGDIPGYITGIVDLESMISVNEDADLTFENNKSGEWNKIDNSDSWDTSSVSDGPVDIRVNATDEAGNMNSTEFDTVIDNTAPDSFELKPEETQYLQPGESLESSYSYVEMNPLETNILLRYSNRTEASRDTFTEGDSDPDSQVSKDTSGLEDGIYSLEVFAEDKVGLTGSLEGTDVFIDSSSPVIENGTYYNDTHRSFQITDGLSGMNSSTVDNSSFEVLTDSVEASEFNITECEMGAERCTVNFSLNESSSVAEIGVNSGEKVADRAGNNVENSLSIIDPDIVAPRANYSLNVSTPLTLDDAEKTVGFDINFSKEMNNSQGAKVEFKDSDTDYMIDMSFENATFLNGTFEVVDDTQEENITVFVSDVTDTDDNPLLTNSIGEFEVDMRPPEISLENVSSNVSGVLDLEEKVTEASTGYRSINYSYFNGTENVIDNPGYWNTSKLDDGDIELRVHAEDRNGNNASRNKDLTVDNHPPVLETAEIQAVDDEPLSKLDDFQITVNASDNGTGISNVKANVSELTGNNSYEEITPDSGLFQRTFQITEEVDIDEFKADITIEDHAGNSVAGVTNSSITVDSFTEEEDDEEDEEDSDSSSGSSGGSGGSGGGAGGIFDPGDDEDDETDEDTGDDNESILDPIISPQIDITPSEETIRIEQGEETVYRPSVAASEPVNIEVDVQGLENIVSFRESFEIDESREIAIPISGERSTGLYTGTIVASAGEASKTSTLNVEIIQDESEEDEADISTRIDEDEDKLRINGTVEDTENSHLTMIYTIYNENGDEVTSHETDIASEDDRIKDSFSVSDLDPGYYTIETVIEDGDDTYITSDSFRIEDDSNILPIALTLALLLGGLYVVAERHGNKARHPEKSVQNFKQERPVEVTGTTTGNRGKQEFGRSSENTQASQSTKESTETDGFDKLDEMFGEEDIIQDTGKASRLMDEGKVKEADDTLEKVKSSEFFKESGMKDIKDKVKKVHRSFEERIHD